MFRKYRILIVIAFMGIFATKMVLSGAPVFFSLDKKLMRAVIMQLEEETKGEGTKDSIKYADHKLMFQHIHDFYIPVVIDHGYTNEIIEHSRRYVDPYHPMVPTPPPNFS
jgi:hypothetical protein